MQSGQLFTQICTIFAPKQTPHGTMNYFIIAGEASGDIHGSQLVASIKKADEKAEFRFLGGDMMAQEAGHAPIIHYRDMAFMGFVEVLKHLGSIMGFMRTVKAEISANRPDALILIDYPSFNLRVAEYAHSIGIPVFYFISPKVWAWKEFRIKQIKKCVDHMFSILPFEVSFYKKHNYAVQYVGNPTVKEIAEASLTFRSCNEFLAANGCSVGKPIIALVPGSRVKEIKDNLPSMVAAASRHPDYTAIIAGAPGIDHSLYAHVLGDYDMPVVYGQTFELTHHAHAALVTSGTATLETALLHTPQVACYRMNGSKLIYNFYRRLIHGRFVTLPNLIADKPVIPELLLHHCTPHAIDGILSQLLDDGSALRASMLAGYDEMARMLGDNDCTATAAAQIVSIIAPKG